MTRYLSLSRGGLNSAMERPPSSFMEVRPHVVDLGGCLARKESILGKTGRWEVLGGLGLLWWNGALVWVGPINK